MAKNQSHETGVLKYDRRRGNEFVVQLNAANKSASDLNITISMAANAAAVARARAHRPCESQPAACYNEASLKARNTALIRVW